jgi:uncharacterized protein YdbL (DUF1318 family)
MRVASDCQVMFEKKNLKTGIKKRLPMVVATLLVVLFIFVIIRFLSSLLMPGSATLGTRSSLEATSRTNTASEQKVAQTATVQSQLPKLALQTNPKNRAESIPPPERSGDFPQAFDQLKAMVQNQAAKVRELKARYLVAEGFHGYLIDLKDLNLEQRHTVQQENACRQKIFELIGKRTGHSPDEVAAAFFKMARRSEAGGKSVPGG